MKIIPWLVLMIVFQQTGWSLAQEDIEPPIAGRLPRFSHVVGNYRISMEASPKELCVEDPLTLQVRITGSGPAKYHPRRKLLQIFPKEMSDLFYIEDGPDRQVPGKESWDFEYRLRPKSQKVKYIPTLELIYFSTSQKKYQTAEAEAIPIAVKPRPEVKPPDPSAPSSLGHPEPIYQLEMGDFLLAGRSPPWWRARWILVFLLLAPPLFCAGWFWAWRCKYPDAGRLKRRLRHQAARAAVKSLQAHGGMSMEAILAPVRDYFGLRLGFFIHEPTPLEVKNHLRRLGASRELQHRWACFFQACAAVRFHPDSHVDFRELREEAIGLIQAVENETWLGDNP